MNLAIITGYTNGIGKELSLLLLKNCWHVCGISRSEHKLATNLSNEEMQRLVPYVIDLNDIAIIGITQLLNDLKLKLKVASFKKIYLVHAAANVNVLGPIGRLTCRDINRYFSENLVASAVLLNDFINAFEDHPAKKHASLLSSGAADHSVRGASLYCTSKAALEMLGKTISLEQKAANNPVTVSIIRPGVVDTNMQKKMRSSSIEILPDREMFAAFANEGKLKSAAQIALKLFEEIFENEPENGKTYYF